MAYPPLEAVDITLAAGATDTEFAVIGGELVAVVLPAGAPGSTATILGSCELCPSPAVVSKLDGSAYTMPLSSLPALVVIPLELRTALNTVALRFETPAAADYTVRLYVRR